MRNLRLTEEQLREINNRLTKNAEVRENLIAMAPTPVKSKYGNKKCERDGLTFHSHKEANRYQELALLEKANQIRDLKRQKAYDIVINGMLVCRYIADFVYFQSGKEVVEDSKGYRTAVFQLKKKLMKAVHNIEILET